MTNQPNPLKSQPISAILYLSVETLENAKWVLHKRHAIDSGRYFCAFMLSVVKPFSLRPWLQSFDTRWNRTHHAACRSALGGFNLNQGAAS